MLLIRVFFILVEFGQRIRDVLQFHDGAFFAKVEGVDMDRADEARELHLLELVMDEVSDGIRELDALWTCGKGVPVNIDGHYIVGWQDTGRIWGGISSSVVPRIPVGDVNTVVTLSIYAHDTIQCRESACQQIKDVAPQSG